MPLAFWLARRCKSKHAHDERMLRCNQRTRHDGKHRAFVGFNVIWWNEG